MNIARLFQRHMLKHGRQRKNGAQLNAQLQGLTEADLADMGIKRYQLETNLLG